MVAADSAFPSGYRYRDSSDEKPDRQIDRIAQLEAEGRKARVGMMLDIRGVLTPEQQQKARERLGAGG